MFKRSSFLQYPYTYIFGSSINVYPAILDSMAVILNPPKENEVGAGCAWKFWLIISCSSQYLSGNCNITIWSQYNVGWLW